MTGEYISQGVQQTNEVIGMNQGELLSFSDYINKKIAEFLKLPDGQTLQNVDWSSMMSVLSLISNILITVSLTIFFLWLIRAIGLYVMAKKRGDTNAYFAFIPYACLYTMGKICGKYKIFNIEIKNPEYMLPILLFSMSLPYAAPLSLMIFVFAYNSILYNIYKKTAKNFATLLVFFGFFLPFLQPFFIFFLRNRVDTVNNSNKSNYFQSKRKNQVKN